MIARNERPSALNKKSPFISLIASGAILALSPAAFAGSPVELTNSQLDRVNAGAVALSTSDAQAAGVLALVGTTTNTLSITAPQPGVQEGLATNVGVAVGEATSTGSNFGDSSRTPASSATAVTTSGQASGNSVLSFSGNHTLSVLGVTTQSGFTLAIGRWVL